MAKRYCELCEAVVTKRECQMCGADTVLIPKDVDPQSLICPDRDRARRLEGAQSGDDSAADH